MGDSGGGLLLAEALDALGGRHVGGGLCGGCRKVVLVGRRGKGLSRVFRRRERCGLCEILAGASARLGVCRDLAVRCPSCLGGVEHQFIDYFYCNHSELHHK